MLLLFQDSWSLFLLWPSYYSTLGSKWPAKYRICQSTICEDLPRLKKKTWLPRPTCEDLAYLLWQRSHWFFSIGHFLLSFWGPLRCHPTLHMRWDLFYRRNWLVRPKSLLFRSSAKHSIQADTQASWETTSERTNKPIITIKCVWFLNEKKKNKSWV